MHMKPIDMVNVSKTFKGKKGAQVNALRNLSLEVGEGEVFGFLGPNGAGKSTTIKILMGQIAPSVGSSRLCAIPSMECAARRNVGYLPENPAFYDFMTAREYLRFVGKAFAMGGTEIKHEAERVLELLELADAADRPIRGYSKGMVQRLGLAQTMLHDPDVYILDEPMSGLDPLGRALVKTIIRELRQRGKTVFFSTHITADVEVVCDRVGVIVKGQLMAVDRVASILQNGIEGYTIQYTGKLGDPGEVCISRDQLTPYLERLAADGAIIERIEPKRKDLETFFLDIVAQ